jgi:predicted Rdx family selenoprotein
VNGKLVFSKKAEGRFPEIKELKEAINGLLE